MRSDHLPLTELWHDAKMPTVNNVVVREAALMAWRALSPKSEGSPLSSLFDELRPDGRTRGAGNGLLRLPSDKRNILLSNMVAVWNKFPALRDAKTLSMARSVTMRKIWPSLPPLG